MPLISDYFKSCKNVQKRIFNWNQSISMQSVKMLDCLPSSTVLLVSNNITIM